MRSPAVRQLDAPRSATGAGFPRARYRSCPGFIAGPCVAGLLLSFVLVATAQGADVRLNEIMARNETAVFDSVGRIADWIELYNPNPVEVDLTGLRLTLEMAQTNDWIFPSGSRIQPNGYLVLWCDGSRPASSTFENDLCPGHALNGDSGRIGIYSGTGQLVDQIEYGAQLVDMSFGRSSDQWQLLAYPTPAATNATNAVLGQIEDLCLNEWMANPKSGPDWFEVYSRSPAPVALAGLFITDDAAPAALTQYQVPALSFIGARSWVKWDADKKAVASPTTVPFNLSAKGGLLVISSPSTNLIDRIDYPAQSPGISEGRLPDGAAQIVPFPATPTPGQDNFLPLTNIIINEILTHTDPPLEDAVELYNPGPANVDIGGWFLSNKPENLKRYRIPDGLSVPAGGYFVLYEYQFVGADHFTFNSAHGDAAYLSSGDATGNLTGYRTKMTFGAAAFGVSFGRYISSDDVEFVAMSQRTFGADNPRSLDEFRASAGAPNAYPKVGPIVFNEIMYHPPNRGDTNVTDNTADEYLELHNITSSAVPLYDPSAPVNTWKITGGVTFAFPPGLVMPASAFWLLVSFNPVADPNALAGFRARYGLDANVVILGPYAGKLNNGGDSLELYQPDPPQQWPHPDAGYVPYILVERVKYSDVSPWPVAADGQGSSLQRRRAPDFGNDPVNWFAASPTPSSDNAWLVRDSDADGMPDAWEVAHGFDPNNPSDASLDGDGDGMTNRQEFLAGTDPRDPLSRLALETPQLGANTITIRFMAMAGITYTVQSGDSPESGRWQKWLEVAAKPAAGMVELTDTLASDHPRRFYRIVTPQLP